jgi:hypothetical protein
MCISTLNCEVNKMPKSIWMLPVVAVTVMLLVSGCGGSDESARTTNVSVPNRPLTKEEFVKRADEICQTADEDVYDEAVIYRERHEKKERDELGPIPFEEKIIRAIVFPSIRKQIRELEALGIPEGEEKTVKALLAAAALGMKKAEMDPYEIEGENPSKYPFDRYSELSREYGLGECVNLA